MLSRLVFCETGLIKEKPSKRKKVVQVPGRRDENEKRIATRLLLREAVGARGVVVFSGGLGRKGPVFSRLHLDVGLPWTNSKGPPEFRSNARPPRGPIGPRAARKI